MRKQRWIGFVIFIISGLHLFSQDMVLLSGGVEGGRYAIREWRYHPGDDPGYASMAFDDSSWKAVSPPASLSLQSSLCWIRAELPPMSGAEPVSLYLALGRLDCAAEVFLNGNRIGSRGVFMPKYSTPVNRPSVFLLPSGLWKTGGRNILAVRINAPASSLPISGIEIVDETGARYENSVIAFFNFELYSILGVLCAFIGLYFLALWIARRQDTPNLWYAISSWAIALYFMEMGSTFPLLEYSLNRALAKSCLTISMAALTAFFIDYFKLKRPRLLVVLLAAIPAASILVYLLTRHDNVLLNNAFNGNLPFVQAAILFIVFVTVRAVIRGNRETIPLLIGIVLGVGLGTHDVVFAILNLKPFAWLQGLGFFSMNLSLFVTLTVRSSRLYTELEAYSKDIEDKTQQLSTYIERIEKTANSVSALTAEIDADAGAAAVSAGKLAAEVKRIGENADKQARATQDSKEALERLGASLGTVRAGVDSQAAGLEESADSVVIVADAAAAVSDNVSSTADFARGLDGTAEQGRQATRNLDEAIARIKDAAGEVASITGAVEDFAERTNLLSMNAAIEAAHSGQAGRGFAVIANEIKTLAGASAERAARIRDSIAEITRRIENGVEANAKVLTSFDSVAGGAKLALESILSIGTSLSAQRTATDKLRTALQNLSSSAASIRTEAEGQEEDGQRIRSRMTELVSISNELRSAIAGIAQENAATAETMKRLASVSRDGKEAVAGLRLILESRKNDLVSRAEPAAVK